MKLHIDYVNEFGLGVARDPKGQRIFVPYTLPEENVTILSIKNQGKFLLAALGSIDKSSLVRQTPPCPYYGYCGGCSLQHMNYEFYKDFKKNIVKKALDKLGYEYSALVSREFFVDYGQRRRTVFRAYIKNRALIFGYFAPRTNEIVEIADCLLLKPQINAAIDIIKKCIENFDRRLLSIENPLEIAVTLCDNGIDLLFKSHYSIISIEKKYIVDLPQEIIRISWQHQEVISVITERSIPEVLFDKHKVALPPGAFLQVSEESQDNIINFIVSKINHTKKVIDLFAGNGTYSIPLSQQNTIYAVEGNATALETLKHIKNIATEQRDLYKNPVKSKFIDKFDYVIINPPRNGATPQITEIAKSNIKNAIAVYCDINSFVRDCKIMLSKGWILSDMAIIDQFYQSYHIEVVAVLRKS